MGAEKPDAELRRWLETIPPRLRARLAGVGLVDPYSVGASKPLQEHPADYHPVMADKGNTATHVPPLSPVLNPSWTGREWCTCPICLRQE